MANLLEPLFIGRTLRVLAGIGCFYFAFYVFHLPVDFGELVAVMILGLLGLSFVLGGLLANPGCEVTALPNLILKRKQHFF
ncbi:hypothetical protein MYX84_01855 [Acidobacteria bacterium AH-259-O06]|nr:hypothetical protein [Acidobacteria bacterium AH-259-O06]